MSCGTLGSGWGSNVCFLLRHQVASCCKQHKHVIRHSFLVPCSCVVDCAFACASIIIVSPLIIYVDQLRTTWANHHSVKSPYHWTLSSPPSSQVPHLCSAYSTCSVWHTIHGNTLFTTLFIFSSNLISANTTVHCVTFICYLQHTSTAPM